MEPQDHTDWVRSGAVLVVLAGTALYSFFARKQSAQPRLEGQSGIVEYSALQKGMVSCGLASGTALVLISSFLPVDNRLDAFVLGLIITILGFPTALEIFLVKIQFDRQHLYSQSPWRRARTISWQEVTDLSYSPAMQWYRVHTRSQGIVRLHRYLPAHANFIKLAREMANLPAA